MTTWIGLMSGTSVDGIDAVAIQVDEDHRAAGLLCHLSRPWPHALQEQLRKLPLHPPPSWKRWLELDAAVAAEHAHAVNELRRQPALGDVAITGVGFHGQTIFHAPETGNTLQLGSPAHLAAATGLPVVADFRRADMARGGEGAPLAPLFHQGAFGRAGETVAVLNLGGIANISILDDRALVAGYDTGPANGLMDSWCQEHFDRPYDDQGELARQGQVIEELLSTLLSDAYFSKPAPKSTGREHFSQRWLSPHVTGKEDPKDVLRTLLELTALTITDALHAQPIDRVVLVGGGARNTFLVQRLQKELGATPIGSSDQLGWPTETVEGALIAWLAARCHAGVASDSPAVTGASSAPVLGAIYPAAGKTPL